MQDVVSRYQVGEVLDAGMLHPSTGYALWRSAISERNLHYVQVRQGAMLALFFFFKQKTAYDIDCDWSSDVCSSDLRQARPLSGRIQAIQQEERQGSFVERHRQGLRIR